MNELAEILEANSAHRAAAASAKVDQLRFAEELKAKPIRTERDEWLASAMSAIHRTLSHHTHKTDTDVSRPRKRPRPKKPASDLVVDEDSGGISKVTSLQKPQPALQCTTNSINGKDITVIRARTRVNRPAPPSSHVLGATDRSGASEGMGRGHNRNISKDSTRMVSFDMPRGRDQLISKPPREIPIYMRDIQNTTHQLRQLMQHTDLTSFEIKSAEERAMTPQPRPLSILGVPVGDAAPVDTDGKAAATAFRTPFTPSIPDTKEQIAELLKTLDSPDKQQVLLYMLHLWC